MEKQTLVISFVGEKPTAQASFNAVMELKNSGTVIDDDVDASVCCFTEKELEAAKKVIYSELKIAGAKREVITINRKKPAITDDKIKKIVEVLTKVLDDE